MEGNIGLFVLLDVYFIVSDNTKAKRKNSSISHEIATEDYVGRAQGRSRRRKSPWNLVLIPLVVIGVFGVSIGLFSLLWHLNTWVPSWQHWKVEGHRRRRRTPAFTIPYHTSLFLCWYPPRHVGRQLHRVVYSSCPPHIRARGKRGILHVFPLINVRSRKHSNVCGTSLCDARRCGCSYSQVGGMKESLTNAWSGSAKSASPPALTPGVSHIKCVVVPCLDFHLTRQRVSL